MPLNLGAGGGKKKNQDKGLLAGVAGKLGSLATLGKVDEEDIKAQARGVTDMLNPATVFPALAQAGIDQIKAVPTVATLGAGKLMGKSNDEIVELMESSPASFALDSGNLEKQLDQADDEGFGFGNKFMAGLGTLSPVAQNITNAIAETGIRGGAGVASGISQTGMAGPKLSPNEILEQNAPGIESYGQAAQRGGAGAMLLGDLLNIAPAMKGAGSSLNPLAETALAQRVAGAGAVLERAPLAPISVPGKGIMNAVNRAEVGATAFPRLAESAVPGAATLSAAAEPLAAFGGKVQAGNRIRSRVIEEQARLNPEIKVDLDELDAAGARAIEAQDVAAAEKIAQMKQELINDTKNEARNEAVFNLLREKEAQAAALGGETVGTTAYGQLVDEAGDIVKPGAVDPQLYGLPKTAAPSKVSFAEEFPGKSFTNRPTGDLEYGKNLSAEAKAALDKKYETLPPIAKLAESEKVPLMGAVRQVPENYTEKYIQSALKSLDTPALPEGIGRSTVAGWDKMMGAWKTSVLPFRPAWHTGNLVGNAMGAMLLGEVSPTWFAKNAKRVAKEMDPATATEGLQAVAGRGIGAEVKDIMASEGKNALTRGFKKTAGKSYKAAQSVDDFAHFAVALNRLDANLAAGMADDVARREATQFALKAAGDFGNMSNVERSFIRRAMPFYPWAKHQAKTTLRFPVENPARFLQAQATAQRVQDERKPLPQGTDFLNKSLQLPKGQFLRLSGDIGLGVENNPILDPTATFGGAALPIQALGAAAGLNLARGRALNTSPGQNKASQIAGYTINSTPMSRLVADMVDWGKGEGAIKRDDTRGIEVSDKRPVKNMNADLAGRIPAPLLPYFTGSQVLEPNVKEITKAAKKKEKSAAKAEKTYTKATKRKPK